MSPDRAAAGYYPLACADLEMGSGSQFIDIILFALVAGFLILRLRAVLGRRDGHESRTPDPFAQPKPERPEDKVVRLPERTGGPPMRRPPSPDAAIW